MDARLDPGDAGLTVTLGPAESLDSVAYTYGHAYTTLWDHPDNAALRERRPDPTVLAAQDQVFVPPREKATFTGNATGKRHRFQVSNTPALLRFRPYALAGQGLAQRFEIRRGDSLIGESTAQANGDIVWPLPPVAEDITLRVFFEHFSRDYQLNLRALDPVETLIGVQQRLRALGYLGGECSGRLDDATRAAIGALRLRAGLPAEDEVLSQAVLDTLRQYHGEAPL
ncbi:peptidoglycan-binding domain-containing protein [Pseudomonas sp. 148P]|uniref:Peptidoglycan-binding domain-containing protein n=1 Tax=Pseudomonas ulcerans TaxID=3115852 RepID=A0ABU7HNQ3_9PSED|nr:MULTISPECIES: peptidoglycan-binding domain-containing protein [unclassified Pseudomonas]MEE1923661.1 peptidoglycan-binding domain-containing protein [Pseudomonas sp. 147P]MEE1933159.1 peptidoglycan-binding domain-containing protein [Pseudomonas sp. 148P]